MCCAGAPTLETRSRSATRRGRRKNVSLEGARPRPRATAHGALGIEKEGCRGRELNPRPSDFPGAGSVIQVVPMSPTLHQAEPPRHDDRAPTGRPVEAPRGSLRSLPLPAAPPRRASRRRGRGPRREACPPGAFLLALLLGLGTT